jgi:hypothetical protein
VRRYFVHGIFFARESEPQVGPPGVMVLFGPASTISVTPDRVAPRCVTGSLSKASMMASIALWRSCWLWVPSSIQSSWTRMFGRSRLTPIFGRSTNWGGLPPPGSIVTPFFFQSAGSPSQGESQPNLAVRSSITPDVWKA